MNSGFPNGAAITPKPGSEWSPTERFLSGPAQHPRATRPFVDVQSVLCRRAIFATAVRLGSWIPLLHHQYPIAKQPAFERKTVKYQILYLTCGGVLVEGLGGTAEGTRRFAHVSWSRIICESQPEHRNDTVWGERRSALLHVRSRRRHSTIKSARASNEEGTESLKALAVLMLSPNSYLDGCSTGISAATVPRRIK